MNVLTRQDIVQVLGPVDEDLAAELMRTGASAEELREANAWLCNDEALLNERRCFPVGRAAELVDILRSREEDEERL